MGATQPGLAWPALASRLGTPARVTQGRESHGLHRGAPRGPRLNSLLLELLPPSTSHRKAFRVLSSLCASFMREKGEGSLLTLSSQPGAWSPPPHGHAEPQTNLNFSQPVSPTPIQALPGAPPPCPATVVARSGLPWVPARPGQSFQHTKDFTDSLPHFSKSCAAPEHVFMRLQL